MKKLSIFLFFIGIGISCQDKNTNVNKETSEINTEKTTSAFTMYEFTEGAMLMEEMFAYNTQLKEKIRSNKDLGEMPEKFKKLPMVDLTEPSDRDEFYLTKANEFLKFQEAIYTAEDPKKAFNQMVSSCIECHQQKCGGPIPRIKRLYID